MHLTEQSVVCRAVRARVALVEAASHEQLAERGQLQRVELFQLVGVRFWPALELRELCGIGHEGRGQNAHRRGVCQLSSSEKGTAKRQASLSTSPLLRRRKDCRQSRARGVQWAFRQFAGET